MRKLIIAAFCFFMVTAVDGQISRFDTCQNIHKYAGEWLYANGSDTLRVYLRTQRDLYFNGTTMEDRIFGWHEYKHGNVIVESLYQNRYIPLTNVDTLSKNSFSIGLKMGTDVDCTSGLPKASGTITDYHQGREGKLLILTLDASGTIMTWKERHGEGFGFFSGFTGMTLPKDLILIKQ